MNTKMKVLSLALVGLCGYAGSALAGTTCPSSPVPPWTAVNAIGGTAVVATGGYAGTACRLDSALTGDTTAFATVEDDSPNGENRYRAQFIISGDNIAALSGVDAVYIFSATSATASSIPVQLSVVGNGTGLSLTFIVPNASAAGGVEVGTYPLMAGPNHVEFDIDNGHTGAGTPGHFSLWVNNPTEASPTFTTTTFDNGSATVDTAFLGLAGATPGYLTAFSGTTVGFDQFDSRRTGFIGGF